jgi:hypothetical protein
MTNGNGAPPEAAAPPQLNVLAQYTKDLSFENPERAGLAGAAATTACDQYPGSTSAPTISPKTSSK